MLGPGNIMVNKTLQYHPVERRLLLNSFPRGTLLLFAGQRRRGAET